MYALAIISVGPSVIAPVLYLTLRIFGVNWVGGYGFDATSALLLPILLAMANWPFVVLYVICRSKIKRELPSANAVRVAMWFSLVAMFVPNVLLFFSAPVDIIWKAPDAGEATGYLIGILTFGPVPILGVIGWFVGRFVAWIMNQKNQ